MPIDLRSRIETALHAFSRGDLTANCIELLDALGYRSGRRLALAPNTAANFARTFAGTRGLDPAQARLEEWNEANFVMQLTDSEISQPAQMSLLREEGAWNGGVYRSFALLAIGLNGASYSRTALATITRAVNRLFDMPAPVFFRYGDKLTLAIILRRPGTRDAQKDVLEKVTLIKDIDLRHPHAAHIRILEELALDNLRGQHSVTSFDELQNAWAQTLNISELNKRFYQEIANWYFWAVKQSVFPNDANDEPGAVAASSVIRLITRLIFVWFVKEKGLIPDALFQQPRVAELLRDFAPEASSYYKAILQNLFFATLNSEMNTAEKPDNRKFRSRNKNASGLDPHYGIHTLYRYADFFRDPAAALQLFAGIPFLNGGLFECLDKEVVGEGRRRMQRVDGFSDSAENRLAVPNFLFFGPERAVDLNAEYGSSNRRYTVRGLIETFQRYKFTVEENTPIEEEIALDPELLGKVFENLLAAYNPETGATARKQTGSFYTPREIVEYMVDEALIAYLETQLLAALPPRPALTPGTPASQSALFGDAPPVQSHLSIQDAPPDDAERAALVYRLRHLFAYNQQPHPFSQSETQQLIAAIDRLKLLDPACGSGAFPMGVLHKLVFVLGKLDPGNAGWRDLQRRRAIAETDAAYRIGDRAERKRRLDEIEEVFAGNSSDYGRKLYLIENCIYGVDIQPIAVQIAKLRFFVSLVVDQSSDPGQPNRGIRPLPNLETKFVAANTLLGIERPQLQIAFRNPQIETKEAELAEVRRRHFLARTPATKQKRRDEDERLRGEIADLLRGDGWSDAVASQLARWNPYDQNAHADFFDPEWMFEMQAGFDIVLGNPPYVRADSGEIHLALRKRMVASGQYETLWEKWDLYIAFIEIGYKLLRSGGITTMIVSDAYCHSKYAQKSQTWFLQNSRILRLDFLSKIQIFDAAVRNITYFFQKAEGSDNQPERRVHNPEFGTVNLLTTNAQSQLTYRTFFPEDLATNEFKVPTIPVNDICYISVGMVVHADEKVAQGAFELSDLVSDLRDSIHSKPFAEGKHLEKWIPITHRWLEWDTDRAPRLFRRPTFPEIYDADVKLLASRMSGQSVKVCYDSNNLLCNHTVIVFVPWMGLRDVRNKSLKMVARYKDEKPVRGDLPDRRALEGLSQRFSIKYVLAVMNSSFSNRFLQSTRRSNTDLYPDDWRALSIPDISLEQQQTVVELVDQILAAKVQDPAADVRALEGEIDRLVYALYGLTEEEIRIVEGKT